MRVGSLFLDELRLRVRRVRMGRVPRREEGRTSPDTKTTSKYVHTYHRHVRELQRLFAFRSKDTKAKQKVCPGHTVMDPNEYKQEKQVLTPTLSTTSVTTHGTLARPGERST